MFSAPPPRKPIASRADGCPREVRKGVLKLNESVMFTPETRRLFFACDRTDDGPPGAGAL